MVGSIIYGPVQGVFPPDHGVSVVVMREVAVLAFKAVTRWMRYMAMPYDACQMLA